jgi:hypothetical protein
VTIWILAAADTDSIRWGIMSDNKKTEENNNNTNGMTAMIISLSFDSTSRISN